MTRLAISLAAIALLASPALGATCEPPKPAEQIRCDFPGVVDGDTLRCPSGTRVRIWGVNAVERGEPGYAEAGRALQAITREPLSCQVF